METARSEDLSGKDYITKIVKELGERRCLKIMQNCDGFLGDPVEYLGHADAVVEWTQPNIAQQLFLHTESYHNFIRESSLVLLGRTGTGKTAILQCLKDDVNSNRETTYQKAIYLEFDPLLRKIKNITEAIEEGKDSSAELFEMIEIYVFVEVMKDALNNPKSFDSPSSTNQIDTIRKYLSSVGADKKSILDIISECLDNGKPSDLTGVISFAYILKDIAAATCKQFKNCSYTEAKDALAKLLLENSCKYLVLIDNAEEYPLKEASVLATIKALIRVCFKFKAALNQTNIIAKTSIPSEVYTSVLDELPAKHQGNTVVIQWTNNELKRMIALRLVYLYSLCKTGEATSGFELPTHQNIFDCFAEISDKELYYEKKVDSISNAQRLLSLILPDKIPTSLSFAVDTFPYILHHTLKKPREVLELFNHIIGMIDKHNSINYFMDNPDEIRNIVHGCQSSLISKCLSMYNNTFEGITDVCAAILSDATFCFTVDTLNKALRGETSRKTYDEETVKRILLESGLVGEIANVHINENNIYLIKARFEYQSKGKLSFKRTMGYVLHPMCYEHFSCKLHEDALVYPSGTDETELIHSIVRV